jgi:dihydroorotase-like cyclic amidohydrolase
VASLSLKNGFVVTPDAVVPGGISSEDGVITAIGSPESFPSADLEIDVHGSYILPGVIDPHVHLGTGGTAYDAKFLEDLITETRSAAAGGVTTLVTDHENANGSSWITTRVTREGTPLLQLAKEAIAPRSPIDVRYTANPCTDDHLADIPMLVEQSVTSFKMFPSYVGEAAAEFGITTVDMSFIFRAQETIGRLDQPWRPTQGMVHCEEPGICDLLKARHRDSHESLEWWARSRPAICEAMQIFDVGMIAKATGSRVYIPHVSSEEGVRTIEYLRTRGADVVGETCPHYLLANFPWGTGSFGKVNPPVRGGDDVEYMWHGISTGVIDVLGSDNCRFTLAEKRAKSLWDAIPGFSEIAASLPILLTHGIAAGRIDWLELAALTAENPARRFAMYPTKGALQVGADADFVVVDPAERWVMRADDLPPTVEASIYEGMEMTGRQRMTIRRGEVIAEGGWVATDGGRYVESPGPS